MNLADFQKVNALISEKQAIQAALQVLGGGGRIIGMTVAQTLGGARPPISVPTGYITYPSQMVDAIRSAFTTREQEITQELTQLGVTGM